MYFERFPYTYYSLDDGATAQIIKNITFRVAISKALKEEYGAYDEYDVLDGETPEIVSDRIYGNSTYHWVILHFNDIIDPRFEWPLSSYNLLQYCTAKYTNINDIHHYEDIDGNIVFEGSSGGPVGSFPVTNFDYESSLNEQKRRIKILKPQYLNDIVSEFEDKLQL